MKVSDSLNHLGLDCDHISIELLYNDAEVPQ